MGWGGFISGIRFEQDLSTKRITWKKPAGFLRPWTKLTRLMPGSHTGIIEADCGREWLSSTEAVLPLRLKTKAALPLPLLYARGFPATLRRISCWDSRPCVTRIGRDWDFSLRSRISPTMYIRSPRRVSFLPANISIRGFFQRQ